MPVFSKLIHTAIVKRQSPIIKLLKRQGLQPPAGESESYPVQSVRSSVSQRDVPTLLHVPKTLIAEMISHALESDPDECCGILIGKKDRASTGRRVRNTHDNPVSRYTMDPLEVSKVEREAAALGQEIVAIYHSHTYTQAYPSETDVRNAVESGWADRYYVLVSLAEKVRPIVRAFWITEGSAVTEVFLQAEDAELL